MQLSVSFDGVYCPFSSNLERPRSGAAGSSMQVMDQGRYRIAPPKSLACPVIHKVGRERSSQHVFDDTPTVKRVAQNMASSENAQPSEMNGLEESPVINGMDTASQADAAQSSSNMSLPRTPSLGSLALTEYSAQPTPPTEDRKTRVNKIVPDEFLLPNGNPDVRSLGSSSFAKPRLFIGVIH